MAKFAAFREGAASEESPTQDEMGAMLARVATSARSAEGIAKALSGVVGMLLRCSWLEGALRMELVGDPQSVTVHFYTEQGSVRERALTAATFAISLDELDVALQGASALFAPLRLRHHKGKLVFTQAGLADTLPPPDIEVSSESLVSDVDTNPHVKATVKQPPFVMPPRTPSGTHRRGGSNDGG